MDEDFSQDNSKQDYPDKMESKSFQSFNAKSIENEPAIQPQSTNDSTITQQSSNPTVELASSKSVSHSPGLMVLQWLTYSFWGWTVLTMSILTVTVFQFFINNQDSVGGFVPYGIAAVLVLLPISVICEIFFMKREPEKKTGISSTIMIVHAVIFALFGIASLIAVAFSIVNLIIESSNTDGMLAVLLSAAIVAFFYAILFLRTILPSKLFWMRRYIIIIMVIIVGVITAMGILGPVNETTLSKTDRLIESNLPMISNKIESYVSTNKKLPDNLNTLNLTDDAEKLVTNKLVTYKKDGQSPYPNAIDAYYYQLCVNYRKESTSRNSYEMDDYHLSTKISQRDTYPSTYDHVAGEVCYKLNVDDYSSDN